MLWKECTYMCLDIISSKSWNNFGEIIIWTYLIRMIMREFGGPSWWMIWNSYMNIMDSCVLTFSLPFEGNGFEMEIFSIIFWRWWSCEALFIPWHFKSDGFITYPGFCKVLILLWLHFITHNKVWNQYLWIFIMLQSLWMHYVSICVGNDTITRHDFIMLQFDISDMKNSRRETRFHTFLWTGSYSVKRIPS